MHSLDLTEDQARSRHDGSVRQRGQAHSSRNAHKSLTGSGARRAVDGPRSGRRGWVRPASTPTSPWPRHLVKDLRGVLTSDQRDQLEKESPRPLTTCRPDGACRATTADSPRILNAAGSSRTWRRARRRCDHPTAIIMSARLRCAAEPAHPRGGSSGRRPAPSWRPTCRATSNPPIGAARPGSRSRALGRNPLQRDVSVARGPMTSIMGSWRARSPSESIVAIGKEDADSGHRDLPGSRPAARRAANMGARI
jgi:hypothetical protein